VETTWFATAVVNVESDYRMIKYDENWYTKGCGRRL
jgi:hypothetical protein